MILAAALTLALTGAWVYCALAAIAARRWKAVRPPPLTDPAAVSVLKPLAGADEGLEENLRSFFLQDYPAPFEILFAVRERSDPSVPIVESLRREFPDIPAALVVTGEPPYPHAKVYSLSRMIAQSRHGLLVMSDSDIRAGRDLLSGLAAEFQTASTGIATCPYRAVPGRGIWPRLEAIGMNTDFHAGVFTARMLEGMKFAVGPTVAARREVIEAIGGIDAVKDYLSSEDFMLGKLVAEAGFGSILSSCVVEHRIGSEGMKSNFAHRMRWARTSRRSRPAGYVGQFFTFPLPIALALTAAKPEWWPLLAITALLRAFTAWTVSRYALGARVPWPLLPLQDLLGFCFWLAGFFGNTIEWRGRKYRLGRDGRCL